MEVQEKQPAPLPPLVLWSEVRKRGWRPWKIALEGQQISVLMRRK